jgi:hypothetical protein
MSVSQFKKPNNNKKNSNSNDDPHASIRTSAPAQATATMECMGGQPAREEAWRKTKRKTGGKKKTMQKNLKPRRRRRLVVRVAMHWSG